MLNPFQPNPPILFPQLIQGLGSNGFVEELDAHLADASVVDDGLEVFFGQRRLGIDGHATLVAAYDGIEHAVLEHQVAVHQHNIVVLQGLPGAIDGVDVVRLVVQRIPHKRERQGQGEGLAIMDEHLVEVACGHDYLGQSGLGNQP